jgi:hypothetical protein
MFMVENQSAHAARVIKEAHRRGATMAEIRREPHDRFFNTILSRQRNTIFFNNSCGTANSYYFDAHGDAPFLRPSLALESWWRARHFDLNDYRFETIAEPLPFERQAHIARPHTVRSEPHLELIEGSRRL